LAPEKIEKAWERHREKSADELLEQIHVVKGDLEMLGSMIERFKFY
jgi:hypothetical protein